MANYSIDGGPPQNRSVPSNSGCNIPQEPFFSMTELPEGNHNITVTVVQVGARPFMFNFFALDPKGQSSGQHHTKKSNAGKIAGGVIGGLILLALICGISFFFWRKRRSCNVYARNRAIDARLQPQMFVPQDMFNRDMQKQYEGYGSSRGSFRESIPAASASLGMQTVALLLFAGMY